MFNSNPDRNIDLGRLLLLVRSYFLHNSTFRRRETFPAVLNSSHACLQRVRLAWRSSSQGMYSSPRSILAHSLEDVIVMMRMSDLGVTLRELAINGVEMRCALLSYT